MTNDYEMVDANRTDLIYDKDRLLAPMEDGMRPPPHPMAPGTTAEDYYTGSVSAAGDTDPEAPTGGLPS